MSDWLAEAGVTHVALESTGEYWKPVYNVLESSFELLLVNAKHIKQVPGRKTDVNDAQWLAQWLADLLQHGLMKASFVPPAPQRAFRELTRARTTFVRERATLSNRVQKVLESANIKLASVATDILGLSGRSMLRALSQGVTDASELAGLAKGQLRKKQVELEQALTGKVETHHRIILSELLCTIESLDATIARLDAAIEEQCRTNGSNGSNTPPPGKTSSGGSSQQAGEAGTGVGADLTPLSYDAAVALLDTIPGVARTTAEIIISEIGTDMSRFPSDAHLAAWTGVAPGNNRSAGKPVGTQARHGNRSVRTTLVQAANSAVRVKGTYLQAQYKRLVVRRQHKRSVMAVAHSIIVAIFHMLKNHEPYRDLGAEHFDRDRPETTVKRLTKRIRNLGYLVEVQPLEMTS